MTNELQPVIVTTKHKGVFVGQMDAKTAFDAEIVHLKRCRMAITFKSTGVLGLAHGPTGRVSGMSPSSTIRDVTAIFGVTDDGWAAWEAVDEKKGKS